MVIVGISIMKRQPAAGSGLQVSKPEKESLAGYFFLAILL
jgi:hypothetical protein